VFREHGGKHALDNVAKLKPSSAYMSPDFITGAASDDFRESHQGFNSHGPESPWRRTQGSDL